MNRDAVFLANSMSNAALAEVRLRKKDLPIALDHDNLDKLPAEDHQECHRFSNSYLFWKQEKRIGILAFLQWEA